MSHYVLALDIDLDDAALLGDHPPEVDDQLYRLRDGVRLTDWFPPHAEYAMSARYPDARRLYDLQDNTLRLLVVSAALRATMEHVGAANVEFLPITIRNHRKKVASKEYSIVNVLGLSDCVDLSKSEVRWDPMIPTRFDRIKKLMLIPDRVPRDVHIFRLVQRPWTHIVTEAFKLAVEERKLTGMKFIRPEEFDSAFCRAA